MYQETVTTRPNQGTGEKPDDEWTETGQTTGCCAPASVQGVQECPCRSALKDHRVGASIVCAGVALALLISQVGGILGVIAFFRTF